MKINRIIFSGVIFIFSFFLSGCDFFVPEDDLNGRNEKVMVKENVELDENKYKESQKTKTENDLEQLSQSVSQHVASAKNNAPKAEEKPQIIEKTPIEKEFLNYYSKYTKATIITNLGKIKVSFYNEDAPLAVGNFIKLAETGFYERIKFHRVISGFMIQAGDPNSRDDKWEDDGQGGPGYAFKDEPNNHKLVKGALAMANSGKDTNGSQFFILTAESKPDLDGKHTVFGEVIDGMKTVEDIEKVRINDNSHPTQDVVIEKIELEK